MTQPSAAGRVIVATAANSGFFHFLLELVASIRAAEDAPVVDIGCYDLGLKADELAQLAALGVTIVMPVTQLVAPQALKQSLDLGSMARPYLPENFPGYTTYVWLDSDAWIQSGEALRGLVAAAQDNGAALIREDGPGYKPTFRMFLWTAKHYLLGYGVLRGGWLLFRPQVNSGVFAMRADAPHWAVWRRHYQSAVRRSGRALPHDQFSLNAAVYFGGPPTHFLPATYNWICDLARPEWDEEASCFCIADGTRRRIEVIHLAGPIKRRSTDIRTTGGRILHGFLRFRAELRDVTPATEKLGRWPATGKADVMPVP